MKKIIALLLALVMCCGMFFGCANNTEEGPTLEDAVNYLTSAYRDDEGKTTPATYKMPAQVLIDGVSFEITWTCDLETISFELVNGLYEVKVPSKNETEIQYILTATIKDADGNETTKQFTRILPVYDDGAAEVELVEGQAYKLFFVQANLGKTLYCIGEAQNDKYIKTDVDPVNGADFYAEAVEGGYKFYTEIGGQKMYLHASTTTSDEGKVSKYLSYVAESDAVYYYKAEVKTWMTKIDNIEYGVGTYSSYETMSLSEGSYFTADSAGVTQFCMALITKEAAEAMAPTEGPKDPTELSSITDLLAIADKLENSAQTAEKYLVKGTITEIANTTYGNMYIQDEAGNQLYVYGMYSKDGADRYDAMDPQPQVGDTVTLMGVLSKYNDAGQMKNAWVQELVAGAGSGDNTDAPSTGDNTTTTPSTDPAADSTLTIAEAIALGESKEHNTYTEGKYYVSGEITEVYNTTYGNMKIKDSKGNILTIYGTFDAKGVNRYDAMTTKPVAGDTVKIYGIIGQYNGTAQIKNGWIVEHKAASSSGSSSSGSSSSGSSSSGSSSSGGSTSTTTTLSTSKNYYLQSVNANGDLYFNGTITNGRINAATAKADAATVKLEKAADGEYYIYFTAGTTKTYISGVLNETTKAASFVLTATKDDSCIWLIDESAKTITSKALETRGIATQNTSTHDNFSTYATSNFTESNYNAAWFVEASAAQAGPADTGASSGSSSSGGSSSGGSSSGSTSGSEATYVTAPQTGKAYKLGMWQSSKSENYYFTGEMSGYYGASETDKSLAVDVYLEDAGNGAYYIYFMNGSTKNYIYGEASGNYLNFKFGTTKSTFTWNAEYNTFTTVIGETEVFMGTYSYYVTFGMSNVDYLSTSYVAHLYE